MSKSISNVISYWVYASHNQMWWPSHEVLRVGFRQDDYLVMATILLDLTWSSLYLHLMQYQYIDLVLVAQVYNNEVKINHLKAAVKKKKTF